MSLVKLFWSFLLVSNWLACSVFLRWVTGGYGGSGGVYDGRGGGGGGGGGSAVATVEEEAAGGKTEKEMEILPFGIGGGMGGAFSQDGQRGRDGGPFKTKIVPS